VSRRRAAAAVLALTAWLSFCVWMFAFSYSDSYFKYSQCSRIPLFAAAMVGAAVIPVGAFLVFRRLGSALGAILAQVVVSALGLAPLAATSFLLSRMRGPCRLSGDDSMGVGINFLLLCGIAALSVAAVALAAMVRSANRARRAGSAP
jgi:hypothetical protein